MFYEMFLECSKKCPFNLKSDGKISFCGICENCVLKHEKTILFGGEHFTEMTFEDFKSIYNYFKEKISIIKIDDEYNILFKILKNETQKNEETLVFLNFCVENNIFKNFCVKELRKALNQRFELWK